MILLRCQSDDGNSRRFVQIFLHYYTHTIIRTRTPLHRFLHIIILLREAHRVQRDTRTALSEIYDCLATYCIARFDAGSANIYTYIYITPYTPPLRRRPKSRASYIIYNIL